MNNEEIASLFSEDAKRGRPPKYPFSEMEVGDIVSVENDLKIQRYVYTYGYIRGKKFKTRSNGDVLYVKRVG